MRDRLDATLERRLGWLLVGRVGLALVSFAIALGLGSLGSGLSSGARSGLGWTLGLAVLATAASMLGYRRMSDPQRFAALQLGIDVVLVTALVYFTGGRDSVFTFLYVFVTVYGALLFERRGALAAAGLSALSFGLILLGRNEGWLFVSGDPLDAVSWGSLAAIWGVHVGALFLVGALASVLSGDLHRAGAALREQSTDLRRLRDLYQRTVESIMSGLLTTDSSGRITSFNPEAERITGAGVAEVLGGDLDAVIPGARELLQGSAQRGSAAIARRSRLRYRNRHEDDLFLGLAGSVLKEADASRAGHVLIFQDVTKVVAMEEELRRSERMAAVGEMGAKIAHEIRNPLAAISGSVQMLKRVAENTSAEGETVRLMDIVVRETERLDGLLSDFLNFSSPRPLRVERVDTAVLIAEFAEMLRAGCPREIEVHVDTEFEGCVEADAGELRQALWNLCINGIHAMQNEGRLEISARKASPTSSQGAGGAHRSAVGWARGELPADLDESSRWLEIAVTDTGIGIPQEVIEHIFEPFFTTKKEGSGLGLAVVHRVVESHGGFLKVESREGQGTSFRMLLPCREKRS